MQTVEILGKIALREVKREDYYAWAEARLMDGADSESTAILAAMGLDDSDDLFEVQKSFYKALAELKLSPPERKTALRDYARHMAEEIVAGRVPPRVGLGELSKFYAGSDYKDGLFEIWFWIQEALDLWEYDGTLVLTGLTFENPDELIKWEATAFVGLSEDANLENVRKLIYCRACGTLRGCHNEVVKPGRTGHIASLFWACVDIRKSEVYATYAAVMTCARFLSIPTGSNPMKQRVDGL